MTARGGHIGFMEGIFPTNKYYSDRIYKQLVRGIFSNLGDMKEVKREAADYVKMMAHSCEGGGS